MGKKEPILEHIDFLGQFSNPFCVAKKIDTLQETSIVARYVYIFPLSVANRS